MAHAEICPVCLAEGKIPKDKWIPSDLITCPGCGGRRWIEVQDNPVYWPPPPSKGAFDTNAQPDLA